MQQKPDNHLLTLFSRFMLCRPSFIVGHRMSSCLVHYIHLRHALVWFVLRGM
jgi:hypothetical protein